MYAVPMMGKSAPTVRRLYIADAEFKFNQKFKRSGDLCRTMLAARSRSV